MGKGYNLKEYVKQNMPNWANDIIIFYDNDIDMDTRLYPKSYYWCGNTSINIHDVTGTAHPDYSDNTWMDLLNYGKRMNINLPLWEQQPEYYYETAKKEPDMEFREVDGRTFIHMEGNHRTCIARFAFYYEGITTFHGVKLDKYEINHEIKQAHQLIIKLLEQKHIPGRVDVLKNTLSRTDTAGWFREEYELAVVLNSGGQQLIFNNLQEVIELILDSQRPFNKLFGKYKNLWKTGR